MKRIKLINEEFAQYQQVCVTGIADINRLKERLFNGERKEELVTAWLLRISRRVNAFLSQQYYFYYLILHIFTVLINF